MEREKIKEKIKENHKSFIDYLVTLSDEEFEFSYKQHFQALMKNLLPW
jgi:hypothetical protein